MRILVLTIFTLIRITVFSQELRVSPAAQRAKHTPFWVNYSPRLLSKHLTKKCTSENEKVIAMYVWITEHIRYDAKQFQKSALRKQSPKATLRRRKAICTQYSDLFIQLCKHAGITAIGIEGYYKGGFYEKDDVFYTANHEWNAVKIDNSWYLFDLTLASGYLDFTPFLHERIRALFTPWPLTKSKLAFVKERNDVFYKIHPAQLSVSHLPITKDFQLLAQPITLFDFEHNEAVQNTAVDNNSPRLTKDFQELADNDPLSLVSLGDSAVRFNCNNAVSSFENYSLAAERTLFSGVPGKTIDYASIQKSFGLIDSAKKMLPSAKKMITEDAYYRQQKNNYRQSLCYDNLVHTQKGNTKIATSSKVKVGNKQKIKRLRKQNRAIDKVIRVYHRKDISHIRTKSGMDKTKADSLIQVNNLQLKTNLAVIEARSKDLDSCYALITETNLAQLSENEERIFQLALTILEQSKGSAELRFNHYDNLDIALINNDAQRAVYVDSVDVFIQQRKLLRDTLKINDRALSANLREIKKYASSSLALMRKNKRLGYDDAAQFNGLKQDVIRKLEMAQQKNNTLINFARQEIARGRQTFRVTRFIGRVLFNEKAYELTRHALKSHLIQGTKKKQLSYCSAISKRNNLLKKEARKQQRVYR